MKTSGQNYEQKEQSHKLKLWILEISNRQSENIINNYKLNSLDQPMTKVIQGKYKQQKADYFHLRPKERIGANFIHLIQPKHLGKIHELFLRH